MMIIWWSKHVGMIVNVLVCDIWINVSIQTSALVGPLYIVNWNSRWNSGIFNTCIMLCGLCSSNDVQLRHKPLESLSVLFKGPWPAPSTSLPAEDISSLSYLKGHRGPVYKGLGAMNPCDNLSYLKKKIFNLTQLFISVLQMYWMNL
jgi:hypothetical protein